MLILPDADVEVSSSVFFNLSIYPFLGLYEHVCLPTNGSKSKWSREAGIDKTSFLVVDSCDMSLDASYSKQKMTCSGCFGGGGTLDCTREQKPNTEKFVEGRGETSVTGKGEGGAVKFDTDCVYEE